MNIIEKKEKTFESFDNQIKKLKDRKLVIIDEKKLKSYLKNFNYQNFINGYNDFFMKDYERKTNVYNPEANSDMILTLFNFDRKLAGDILPYILSIERKLSTSITYNILDIYKDYNDDILHGKILKIDDEWILNIFASLSDEDKEDEKIYIQKLRSKIQGIQNKNDKKTKDYENKNDIPLWTLCINWSMGDSIYLYSKLDKKIQKKIIQDFYEEFLDNFYENFLDDSYEKFFNDSCKEFVNDFFEKEYKEFFYEKIYYDFKTILYLIYDIRNIICHNAVLYNFNFENKGHFNNKERIKVFLKKQYKYFGNNNQVSENIRLYEVAFLIDILAPFKKEITLIKEIEYELNKINSSDKNKIIEQKIFDKIKEEMHFK